MDLGFLFDHIFEILGWVSGIFLLYGLVLVIETQFPAKAPEGKLDPPVYID